ncbi:MAG: HAMP domain-containing histidine kinase [Oscillospiraceae bacterium]|nr:HAMP domain-containing histidine kinase [Oscillospiraceae bacterium]
MKSKKTRIRVRLLKAFTAVLFFSFLLIGVIFNIAVRLFVGGDANLRFYFGFSDVLGRASLILLVVVGVMFVVTFVVTYFLSNSLTKSIERLSKFAQNIGHGDFAPNDVSFCEVELENLNMALNKSVKQLDEYDREQKVFFQNASHELRTPLMSIQCYAEGISFGIMEPKAASATILQETEHLADLVTDLLYISKLDNITTAYAVEEVDITTLIQDAAARQEAVAAKKQVRFAFDFGDSPVYYICTRDFMARAIDNLISNAVRYAASEITLSCRECADRIEICIADDGAGIAPDLMPHIFERFTKGPNGNHGIGLSIVKTIVEQRGGRIAVTNGNSGGAIFTITLPR